MLRRFINSLRRKRLDTEIQEEIDFHRSQSSGSFGNVTAIGEQMRNASTIVRFETLLQDLHYGLRILARTPGVSAVAVLSLALGIGANAAIFSLVDRVILSFLPVKQPERLVLFDNAEPFPRFKEFRSRSDVAPLNESRVKWEFPGGKGPRKGRRMKRTRFSEEQIAGILKQGEAGMKTAELCRQHGISEGTFYNWKAKYGGMSVTDVQKLKRLEEENAKLKRVVADLTLDNIVLKDLLSKNF